jgi:replication-associated recombination protein RarA
MIPKMHEVEELPVVVLWGPGGLGRAKSFHQVLTRTID